MKKFFSVFMLSIVLIACKSETDKSEDSNSSQTQEKEQQEDFKVNPISHATMVLEWNDKTIYVDPVGGAERFAEYPLADLILITDIHGDHMSVATLQELNTEKAKIIVPQAVADSIPTEFDAQIDVLNNGESKERFGFNVKAIPMYNLRDESLRFHPKGRGNGYVIESEGKRVYISGDTEDIPEMLELQDIDVAFISVNLPYTMTEIQAAQAIATFKPKTVYPYHYRGAAGFSNMKMFEAALKKKDTANQIELIQLDWYQ